MEEAKGWKDKAKKAGKVGGAGITASAMFFFLWGELKDVRKEYVEGMQIVSRSFAAAIRASERNHRSEMSVIQRNQREDSIRLARIEGLLKSIRRAANEQRKDFDDRFGRTIASPDLRQTGGDG